MPDISFLSDSVDVGEVRNSIGLSDIKTYISEYKGVPDTKMADHMIQPVLFETDTVLFLVNYEDGWELLSADRRAPRVFAMSEKGHISIDSFSECPEIACLFDRFVSNVVFLKQHPEWDDSIVFQDVWSDYLPERSMDWQLVSSDVLWERDSTQNHLTDTRWGQGSPWNIKAPYRDSTRIQHCYTGCVPVAASQVLYYLHQTLGIPDKAYQESSTMAFVPNGTSGLVLQPSDVQLDTASYSSSTWNTMPLVSTSTNSFSGVSTLMLQMGLYLEAHYYQNGTSAYTNYIKDVFETYYSILSNVSYNVDFDIIANQIFIENQPVILSIGRYDNNHSYHGHAVIVDACREHYQEIRRIYKREIPTMNPEQGPQYEFKLELTNEMESRYVGINWGWNGAYMMSDGSTIWFSTDAISWEVAYVYTQLNYMLYGFHVEES